MPHIRFPVPAICVLVSCSAFCSQANGQGGIITTVAGNGANCPPTTFASCGGDGGPATAAGLDIVLGGGVAVDASGNLYIADHGYVRIRKVSAASGIITTVAGNGAQGFSGDGGPATSASLNNAFGVAVDTSGNLFIVDLENFRIRKVSAATGIITTVAGGGSSLGDGGPATSASLGAVGVAVDTSGNLFIADYGNLRIRKVSAATGIITTVAGNGTVASGGDGGPATSASLFGPQGVAVDASGNLFIADNNRIRKVSASGIITTVAGGGTSGLGDGGSATAAELNNPSGVAVDLSGNLFIADNYNNRIREVSAQGPAAPSITSNGIVPIYSTISTIQSGEWVSIYGTNLATSTALYSGSLPYPASLGGTSVTIDGKSAYLYYAGPTLIDLIAPADTATGSVPVAVTTSAGTANATVTLAQFGPSFFLLDSKHVAGIILRTNGSGSQGGGTYDFLGPTVTSLGYATVAAMAGDIVELFASGLGPTNPAVPAGQGSSGAAPTTNPITVLINNVSVTPSYAGASSEAGIYQINLTIPAGLGTGDVRLVATVGGAQTPATVVISLQ